jgi:hypothetical protein
MGEGRQKIDGGKLLLTVTDKRQTGRPTETGQQNSDGINICLQVPQWARHHQDILTD